ncbi:hypothetical protein ON021_29120, partial [Microcoleus sp. HI-ES]|nr:hypothetical protein [Microcoleus sp. HI-ES]MCZ0903967.1 hypothetical protein [Microcoleus sp. HI-ES]
CDRPLAVEIDQRPCSSSNLPSSYKNLNLHPPTSNSLCYSNNCDYWNDTQNASSSGNAGNG